MSMTPGSAPPPAAPILIGVLYDFPQADGGASVEEAIRLGMAEVASAVGSTGSSNWWPARPGACRAERPTTWRRPTPNSSIAASWP